jgi:hypothetical protein
MRVIITQQEIEVLMESKVMCITSCFPEMDIPKDWMLFLTRSENKSSLARFCTESMMANAGPYLERDQQLYRDEIAHLATHAGVVDTDCKP